ncbi:DUF3388 domain-containing protein, partial [Bacillus pumilus]|uniref:DUF3388 domain-containing protein n=1 Tax=Bacillus pumilus TaxID=1408 RepID=UPI0011A87D60
TRTASDEHFHLLTQIITLPTTKLLHHPHIFIQNSQYTIHHFHYIIQFPNTPHQDVAYQHPEEPQLFHHSRFSRFH